MQQKWNQNFDGEPMTDIPQKFLNGESSAKRGPQADAVAEYIEHHKHQSIILAGDFNDSPIH